MKLDFWKYQGAGNDFIMLDNRTGTASKLTTEQIRFLCNRHFGIGADGLIMLENSPNSDFFMRYFNSDGRESTMCGNGGRCIVMLAYHLGIIGESTLFSAIDGLHEATIVSDSFVKLKMSNAQIPVQIFPNHYMIDTGSPHLVVFTDDVSTINVNLLGTELRYNKEISPHGVNVNFCQIENQTILIRTYERGVENETLACGTGSVAAAITSVVTKKINAIPVEVIAKGGRLQVSFEPTNNMITNIYLSGEARKVFYGEIDFDPNFGF